MTKLNQRELFFNRFVEYCSEDGSSYPELKPLVNGLTFEEVEISDLKGVKFTSIVPWLSCNDKNFIVNDIVYKKVGWVEHGLDTSGLTHYDSVLSLTEDNPPYGVYTVSGVSGDTYLVLYVNTSENASEDFLETFMGMSKYSSVEVSLEARPPVFSEDLNSEVIPVLVDDTFITDKGKIVMVTMNQQHIPDAFIGQL